LLDMEIARRGLLGLGAAVVISAATSACRGQEPVTASSPTPTPSPTRSPVVSETPVVSGSPGLPPPGKVYFGASVPHGRSVTAWEDRLGSRLALHRSYFTPDHNETDQLVRQCRDDVRHGRLPHVSIKPTWTWGDIAAGGQDEWLDDLLRQLGESSAPIMLTLHHEPENDAGGDGMRPSDYVAMQRRLLEHAADLAPQVIVTPLLQHWTFDPLNVDGDPRAWIVLDAPVMGLDVYNPWSPSNGKGWRSFGSKLDEVVGWFDDMPLAIGEYGCREDPSVPGLAAEWLHDAAEYARTHNVVSMSYFNSGVQSPDGSWALSGSSEQTFAELLASDWVARIA
jgi:hypothetical protein